MSAPYNYTLYQDLKGQTFVDTLVNRNTYYVADPGQNTSQVRYYQHKTRTSAPQVYATTTTTVPGSSNLNASYTISLYSAATHTPVNCVTVTPTETTVHQNFAVTNDIYIGPTKAWRLKQDPVTNHLLLQTKSSTGDYVTQMQIISSNR